MSVICYPLVEYLDPPNLQGSCSQYARLLVLGHVWGCRALVVGYFLRLLGCHGILLVGPGRSCCAGVSALNDVVLVFVDRLRVLLLALAVGAIVVVDFGLFFLVVDVYITVKAIQLALSFATRLGERASVLQQCKGDSYSL